MCNERLWNYALSYGCMHGGVICDERLEEKSLRPNRVVRHCTPLRCVDAAPPGGGGGRGSCRGAAVGVVWRRVRGAQEARRPLAWSGWRRPRWRPRNSK